MLLPAAWRLNLCPGIIATVPSEILTGVFNFPQGGCWQIGVIDLISEGVEVVPPPIVHLVAGFVQYLPCISAEGCPPHWKRRTPTPAVWPHQLELLKVVSCNWMKKDDIIKEAPFHFILDAANIVYLHKSKDVFQDEFRYTVPIQQ